MKRLMLMALAAALLATGFYWYRGPVPRATVPVIFEVKQEPFTLKITELGELRSLDFVTIRSQISNTVITDLIPEGTLVKKGDVLVRLDPGSLEADLKQSEEEVRVAEAGLRVAEKELEVKRQELHADIDRLESEIRLAQVELTELKRKPLPDEVEKARMELEKAQAAYSNAEKKQELLPALVAKGFITQDTLDNARMSYLEAKASLQVAKFNLATVSAGATPDALERATIKVRQANAALAAVRQSVQPKLQAAEATVERAKAQVAQARNSVNKNRVKLERTILRAPREGLVVYGRVGKKESSAKVQPGTLVWRGSSLIHLPDLSTMVVDTEVNELDIGKVTVGGAAEVRPEAYPGTVFHGHVKEIASLARSKASPSGGASGIKVFDVTVQLDEKDARLRPGLTATVDLIVADQSDTISIPLAAVTSRGDEHVVLVANGGKPETRKVTLGASNDHRVIVKAGLRIGERVLLERPGG
jgi:HlyD family secretion protein